jgi:hypothetical protein
MIPPLPIVDQLRALVERKGQLRAEIGLRAIELRAINDALAEARDLLIASAPVVRVSTPSAATVGIIRPASAPSPLSAAVPDRDNPPKQEPHEQATTLEGEASAAHQTAAVEYEGGLVADEGRTGGIGRVTAPLRAHDVEPDSGRRAEILTFLQTGPQPTRAIAKHLQIDRIVCKMALQRMRKVGLLATIGERNGQRWTLPHMESTLKSSGIPPSPAVVVPIAPRTSPAPSIAAVTAKVDADIIKSRDAEILRLINVNNGVATMSELRARFPKRDPAAADEHQRDEALRNSLLRLKARGLIARTADTWSLVGAGSLPAHG